MIKKRYLTEVVYKNGVDEFKAYRSYTKTFKVTSEETVVDSFRVKLDVQEVDKETISIEIVNKYEVSLQWRSVNGESADYIEIYSDEDGVILNTDSIVVNFVGLNNTVSDLYSVDYETGTLYLASSTNIDLKVDCEYYNLLLTGRAAEQLDSESYDVNSGVVSVNNINTEYGYLCIYNKTEKEEDEYTTPYLSSIKVNYINTDEQESF